MFDHLPESCHCTGGSTSAMLPLPILGGRILPVLLGMRMTLKVVLNSIRQKSTLRFTVH